MFRTKIVLFCLAGILLLSCQNHYKVYRVTSPALPRPITVTVQDQLDKRPVDVTLLGIDYFANPTKKNREPIQQPHIHYTWYRMATPTPPQIHAVTFSDQFGKHQWTLDTPIYLLVPTEKIEPGSQKPKANHYKCYPVRGEQKQITVTLEDQFDKRLKQKEKVIVFKPEYFCLPVNKNREGIVDSSLYYSVYRIDSQGSQYKPSNWNIRNQFGDTTLVVAESQLLCVPVDKLQSIR